VRGLDLGWGWGGIQRVLLLLLQSLPVRSMLDSAMCSAQHPALLPAPLLALQPINTQLVDEWYMTVMMIFS